MSVIGTKVSSMPEVDSVQELDTFYLVRKEGEKFNSHAIKASNLKGFFATQTSGGTTTGITEDQLNAKIKELDDSLKEKIDDVVDLIPAPVTLPDPIDKDALKTEIVNALKEQLAQQPEDKKNFIRGVKLVNNRAEFEVVLDLDPTANKDRIHMIHTRYDIRHTDTQVKEQHNTLERTLVISETADGTRTALNGVKSYQDFYEQVNNGLTKLSIKPLSGSEAPLYLFYDITYEVHDLDTYPLNGLRQPDLSGEPIPPSPEPVTYALYINGSKILEAPSALGQEVINSINNNNVLAYTAGTDIYLSNQNENSDIVVEFKQVNDWNLSIKEPGTHETFVDGNGVFAVRLARKPEPSLIQSEPMPPVMPDPEPYMSPNVEATVTANGVAETFTGVLNSVLHDINTKYNIIGSINNYSGFTSLEYNDSAYNSLTVDIVNADYKTSPDLETKSLTNGDSVFFVHNSNIRAIWTLVEEMAVG